MIDHRYDRFVDGTSALRPETDYQSYARMISYPKDIVPADRSYGVEGLTSEDFTCEPGVVRGTLAGRPLNVFTRAEAVALFVICTLLSFGTFFVW